MDNEPISGLNVDTKGELPQQALAHTEFLRRLAMLQLNNHAEAEDAVQETYMAALKGWSGYSNKVPVRAWLIGILRHKVTDVLRQRNRYVPLDDGIELEIENLQEPDMFSSDGSWDPTTFVFTNTPQEQVARQELLALVEQCMTALPASTARIFLMREYLGMESTEIMEKTALSAGNIRVLLHRARLRLRACVVRGWGEFL
jgi:RNA polymerase sigma-70 factor (ECF subfamily)